ncbi:MAG: hypothetical protein U0228_18305 [Myxococcaceae bacterium]
MIALALLVAVHAAPDTRNTVGVVVFQGAGRAADTTVSLVAALPKAIESKNFPVVTGEEIEKHQRAAAMCGEDAECLATLGRRANVGWVLGLGLGLAGKNTLITALLVDVETGKVQQRYEAKRQGKIDFAALAHDMVEALFAGLSPRPALVPPEPPPVVQANPVDPPPAVVAAQQPPPPAPSSHPLRTAGIGLTVGAGAAAVGGGVLTFVAASHFGTLGTVPADQRQQANADQRGLNVAADVTVGVAIAAGVTALVLFIVDGGQP